MMNKPYLIVLITVVVIALLIVAGILIPNFGKDEDSKGELYTFSLLIEAHIYPFSVRSNYSSPPEVSYSGLFKMVSVDFRGDPENAFCNVTIPTSLIWGELSVFSKGYKMSEANYVITSNSTHNSVYFTFDHFALVKTFDVMGTEGILTVP